MLTDQRRIVALICLPERIGDLALFEITTDDNRVLYEQVPKCQEFFLIRGLCVCG